MMLHQIRSKAAIGQQGGAATTFARLAAIGLLTASTLGCSILKGMTSPAQGSESAASSEKDGDSKSAKSSVTPQPDNIDLQAPNAELAPELRQAFENAAREHMQQSDNFGRSEDYPVKVLKLQASSDWKQRYDDLDWPKKKGKVWAYNVKVAFFRQRNGRFVYPHCWLANVSLFAREKKGAEELQASDIYRGKEGSGQRIDCGDGSWKK